MQKKKKKKLKEESRNKEKKKKAQKLKQTAVLLVSFLIVQLLGVQPKCIQGAHSSPLPVKLLSNCFSVSCRVLERIQWHSLALSFGL